MMLLSIYPKHVDSILKGIKKYEFRKLSLKKNAVKEKFIVVYETKPINSIGIVLKVGEVIEDNIHNLWAHFGNKSGISRDYFFEYYGGSSRGIAIKIEKIIRLKKPLSIFEIRKDYPTFTPPQNLYLINEEKYPVLYKKLKKQFKKIN